MQTLYTSTYVAQLIECYVNKGGNVVVLEEGVLGYGLTVLYGDKLKTVVIKEVPVNSWNSVHSVIKYNKMPEKYRKLIEQYENTIPE